VTPTRYCWTPPGNCGYSAGVGRTIELVVNMPPPGLSPEEEGPDTLATVLCHVADDGQVYVAPLGTPGPPGDGWVHVGPVDDLPAEGHLGGVRRAYWAAQYLEGC
jgi:hypothetical protein